MKRGSFTVFGIAVAGLLMLSLGAASAQYVVYAAKEGVVLFSKSPERVFTLEVPGKKVVPMGGAQETPRFLSDGRFLQVTVVTLKEMGGDAGMDDKALLRLQLKYDADYYKRPVADFHTEELRLKDGRDALLWDYTPEVQNVTAPRQLNLTFRSGDYVVVLGSALVTKAQGMDEMKAFLISVADSFKKYDGMVELKFLDDGSYTAVPVGAARP